MQKRGVIELHFNWIFILIAGALIFVFFISIVNKQREFSEIKTSATIISNLESILTGAQISTSTVNIIDIPKADIGFECSRYFVGPVPKQTKGNVIFAPGLLKGNQIITWALDWSMPYRVTNFLYVTNPQIRYIIVDKPERPGKKIFDELPKEMNKEIINENDVVINKNNYKVKFIFFDDADRGVLANFGSMKDGDLTAIIIKADFTTADIIPDTGNIEFLQQSSSSWLTRGITTPYIKKESLYGAIFAEDTEMYNCVMKKAFEKLSMVTKIYLERCSALEKYYFSANNPCYEPYSNAKIKLAEIGEYSSAEAAEFPKSMLEGMENMASYSSAIKSENQKAQLLSCALIY